MDRPFIFKYLLMFAFILVLPLLVHANLSYSSGSYLQDEKKDKSKKTPDHNKKPDNKQEPNQPDIQKVPKARKQGRPPVVIKPKIKTKPKVIRPNIKRP